MCSHLRNPALADDDLKVTLCPESMSSRRTQAASPGPPPPPQPDWRRHHTKSPALLPPATSQPRQQSPPQTAAAVLESRSPTALLRPRAASSPQEFLFALTHLASSLRRDRRQQFPAPRTQVCQFGSGETQRAPVLTPLRLPQPDLPICTWAAAAPGLPGQKRWKDRERNVAPQ